MLSRAAMNGLSSSDDPTHMWHHLSISPFIHPSIHPPYIILLLNKVKPLALFSTQVRILLPCLCVFFHCLWAWYEYTGSGSEAPMDGIVLRTWEPQAPRGTLPEPSGKTASEPFRHKTGVGWKICNWRSQCRQHALHASYLTFISPIEDVTFC